VHDQLALLGPEVVGDVLARHAAGTLVGDVQDESRATRARKLSKAEATVDFAALDAREARARINGLNSWPGCTVLVGELPAKLLRVEECDGAAGEIGVLGPDGVVQARTGAVRILEIQPIGGRGMPVAEFLNGRPGLVGCAVRPFVPARS